MSTETAILLSDVSKRFKFNRDEADSILDVIISSVRRQSHRHEQILWAVRDVSFSVMTGESVALVGLNGSGKSTILKLAAGIMRPSDGRIEVRGRLSALLELGAGFHPELTGQENIWLNASILGLTNAEISEIYDDIVDFAELDEFINMPVKHYSSGMYMRLGFSVAVHISPDILLIDEILAVGDQTFQEKCVERLHKLKAAGTTVVFVSHNPAIVLSLCERALWIEHGKLVADGPAPEIVAAYLAGQGYDMSVPIGPLSGEIELAEMRLCDSDGNTQDSFEMGQGMTIEVDYVAHRPVSRAEFDVSFQHEGGEFVGGLSGLNDDLTPLIEAGPGTIRCRIDKLPLSPAVYHVSASIFDGNDLTVYDRRDQMCAFQVVDDGARPGRGLLRIPAKWETVSKPASSLGDTPGPGERDSSDLEIDEVSSSTRK